jgi:hypothetical protein
MMKRWLCASARIGSLVRTRNHETLMHTMGILKWPRVE